MSSRAGWSGCAGHSLETPDLTKRAACLFGIRLHSFILIISPLSRRRSVSVVVLFVNWHPETV